MVFNQMAFAYSILFFGRRGCFATLLLRDIFVRYHFAVKRQSTAYQSFKITNAADYCAGLAFTLTGHLLPKPQRHFAAQPKVFYG
jgi:hypothetical protein